MFGRFIFKLLPWWVFFLPLPVFAPLSYEFFQEFWVARQALHSVQGQQGPTPVPLARFDRADVFRPYGELAVIARETGITGKLPGDKIDFSFVLLASSDDPATYMALHREAYRQETLLRQLDEARDAKGDMVIRGFLIEGRGLEGNIRRVLDAKGQSLEGPLYVVDPFFGDRAAALRGHLSDKKLLFIISAVFLVAFAITGVVKFILWRRRVAAKKALAPAPPKQEGRSLPRKPAPTKGPSPAKLHTKDSFADSPIQTKKGWFR
jgi:hypothetical protein